MFGKVTLLILCGVSVISIADESVENRVTGAFSQSVQKPDREAPPSRLKGEFRSTEGDVHKIVRITRQDINEATQLLKGRDATEDEVRRSKDFMRKNSLPSNFEERKVLVEKLIETTFQEDEVSKDDRRKVMRLLYRKEKEAMEQRASRGVADRDKPETDTKETGKTLGEETRGALKDRNDPATSIPSTFLNDSGLNAGALSEIAKPLPASPGPGPTAAFSGPTVQTAQAAGPGDDEPVQQVVPRAGHSGGGTGAAVPLFFPGPIVSLPSGPVASAPQPPAIPVTHFNAEALKSNLEKVLEDRVRNGEITPVEGKQAMKEILNQFESDRASANPKLPRTGQIEAPKTTPGTIPGTPEENEATAKNEVQKPKGITVFGNSGYSTVTIPVAGENSDLVANEMSKILTDFGKLSLEPDGGKGKKPGDAPGGKSGGMVGVMSASGGAPIPASDNSGLTPSIVSKSGGTLALAGKAATDAAAPRDAGKGWLNDMISKYLARKNGKASRMPASPTKAGLPGGSLSPKESAEVSFVPEETTPLAASLAAVTPEREADWFLWLGGVALALSAFWAVRRRNEEPNGTETGSDREAS